MFHKKTNPRDIKYALAASPEDARQRFKNGQVYSFFGELINSIYTRDIDLEKNGLKMYRLAENRFYEVDMRGHRKNDRIKHD